MQQIVYDYTSSQTHLEKSFQLLHLLDFCLLQYLLSLIVKQWQKCQNSIHHSLRQKRAN